MADTLPLRFRVLHYVSTVDKTCVNDILQALAPEYGTEKHFKRADLMEHLFDLKANVLIDDTDVTLDDQGELLIYYSVTAEGKQFLQRFLPKSWQQNQHVSGNSSYSA